MALADAAGDELRVLRAEVHDEHEVGVRRGCRSPRQATEAAQAVTATPFQNATRSAISAAASFGSG